MAVGADLCGVGFGRRLDATEDLFEAVELRAAMRPVMCSMAWRGNTASRSCRVQSGGPGAWGPWWGGTSGDLLG